MNSPTIEESKVKTEDNEKASTICKCCSFKIVSPFTNITTSLVLKRVFFALIPVKANFLDSLENKPDVYGPFWIYATLIFCLAAAGNLSKYFQTPSAVTFYYDFSYLPMAFFLVFALGFSIPLLMYCMLRIFGTQTSMIESICIYGYSIFVFIPISFLCIINNEYCKWALMIYGALSTIVFIIINYWPRLKHVQTRNKYTIVILIVALQLVLFFLFKYYFFQSIYNSSASSSSTTVTESTTAAVVSPKPSTSTSSLGNSTNATTSAIEMLRYMYKMYRIK